MNIEKGLFQFDFVDYHAILGVPLEADPKQIRKRYLKIARRLHPDSMATASDREKQQASELLSKMVNPAYEKLTQEKESAEIKLVLRLRGQQLSRQRHTLTVETASAKQLLDTNNPLLYSNSLNALAEIQYDQLDRVLEIIGQISELNLAYLVTTAAAPAGAAAPAPAPAATPASPGSTPVAKAAPPPPPSPRQQRASILESYMKRAREFEQKKDFSRAILELREAVQAHPNSAECHGYLASLYLQAGQPTMARIHVKRALDIDPDNAMAKTLQPKINKTGRPAGQQTQASAKSRGGLFGLFGGKQK